MALSLLELLMMRGPSKADDLARALDVSQPTLSRMLGSLGSKIVRMGGSKNTRYAAQRAIRQLSTHTLPIWRIDETGASWPMGELRGVSPKGFMVKFSDARWPREDQRQLWFESLPYFIHDIRYQGYMGRSFARQYANLLGVSENPERWTDDEILVTLALLGEDQPGDIIMGEASMRRFSERTWQALPEGEVESTYDALAQQAISNGVAGSSAAGEFPKFTAFREHQGRQSHVIVKFSGAGQSAQEIRWGDLLRAEALAAQVVQGQLGIAAATCRVIAHGGRTFMETERFDRVGAQGRRPLCSLTNLDAELIGLGDPNWGQFCDRLAEMRLLPKDAAARSHRIWAFGKFIGNSDMHGGNLSFTLTDRGKIELAPVYDMLPMRYAPVRGGELPPLAVGGDWPVPAIGREADHEAARQAAMHFWGEIEADSAYSADFRGLAVIWRNYLSAVG